MSTLERSPWGGRPARYATPLTPGLRNRGAEVAMIARVLGRPLLPHQRQIVDVATQMNPPGSHLLWRYQTVVLLLPRQTGKTTVLRPILVDRAQMQPHRQILTTAQLGKDAAARWADLVDDIESGPLKAHVRVKRGNGQEIATFPNRSLIKPFAPGPKAGHGYSPQTVLVDEAWAFDRVGADELMTGLRPAMQTKRDRQMWIISAEGDKTSEWLIDLVAAGRASVSDPYSKTAYFEWSADPDADPYDPATWDFHPGLDGLITLEDLAEEAKPENNSHAAWLRNFLNRRAAVDNTLISLTTWDALADEHQAKPDPDRVALAYDVAIDRTSASIWTAWIDDDGVVQLHVYESHEGADWLPAVVQRAYLDGVATTIGADDGGPARGVTDALRRAGVPVETLGGRDAATAWGNFKAAVADSGKALADKRAVVIRHDGAAALRDGLEVAAERRTGDLRALDRTASAGPIDAPVAAVAAAWFAARVTGPQIF
ncbi:MAG: hypothetical protein HGA44_05595 [Cellulomonadaceae bacterium]|nr:hypothetical protein [Cellulomonadaceae bacterium]